MRIFLNSSSNDPNYLQIENAIRSAICQGQLRPQDQLPSIRQLAKQLQVAIITVKRAYDDLEQAGMIETRQGKGCFVAEKSLEIIRRHLLDEAKSLMGQAIQKARKAGAAEEEICTLFQEQLRRTHHE